MGEHQRASPGGFERAPLVLRTFGRAALPLQLFSSEAVPKRAKRAKRSLSKVVKATPYTPTLCAIRAIQPTLLLSGEIGGVGWSVGCTLVGSFVRRLLLLPLLPLFRTFRACPRPFRCRNDVACNILLAIGSHQTTWVSCFSMNHSRPAERPALVALVTYIGMGWSLLTIAPTAASRRFPNKNSKIFFFFFIYIRKSLLGEAFLKLRFFRLTL